MAAPTLILEASGVIVLDQSGFAIDPQLTGTEGGILVAVMPVRSPGPSPVISTVELGFVPPVDFLNPIGGSEAILDTIRSQLWWKSSIGPNNLTAQIIIELESNADALWYAVWRVTGFTNLGAASSRNFGTIGGVWTLPLQPGGFPSRVVSVHGKFTSVLPTPDHTVEFNLSNAPTATAFCGQSLEVALNDPVDMSGNANEATEVVSSGVALIGTGGSGGVDLGTHRNRPRPLRRNGSGFGYE